jgi:hypothetical protein
MTRFVNRIGLAIAATALYAQTPIPEYQAERQPGLLRVSGISDTDRVLLDGELIGDGRRLTRFGNKLLVNPGQYTVTIVNGGNHTYCSYRISIRENETATARCAHPSPSVERDVD